MLVRRATTRTVVQSSRSWRFWFLLLAFVLLLGVFFRFINLDRKVYWNDESYTSLRLSGYTEMELVQQEYNGQLHTPADLQKYQQLNPDKGWSDTLRSLASEDPQHPPLYYLLARVWTSWFGSSITALRSLSALLSLLIFPALYWLCQELFQSASVGWVAIALLAVSPFHLLYAQEAREYSLWTATILVSSAALLRAIRRRTVPAWAIYAVTLALGLYTFLLTILVAIGHGIYILLLTRFRPTKLWIAYLFASISGIILFVPWLIILTQNLGQVKKTTSWIVEGRLAVPTFLGILIKSFSQVFVDIQVRICAYVPNAHSFESDERFLKYFILLLITLSLYFVYRKNRTAGLFILALCGTIALPFILLDLTKGGIRSITARYMIPVYLGIGVSVAYLLARQFNDSSNKIWQNSWRLITISLISAGIFSCSQISQAESWWNKYSDSCIPWIASVINKADQPLVISSYNSQETDVGHLLTLSRLLDQKVKLQLIEAQSFSKISGSFDRIFLYRPSEDLLKNLSHRYKILSINGYDEFRFLVNTK